VIVAIATIGGLLFAERLARRFSGDKRAAQIRLVALACGLGILLVGPAIWSVETLGHPTSGTFPAGGPESASSMGGPGGGGFGGMSGSPGGGFGGPPSFGGAVGQLFGESSATMSVGPPRMGMAGGGAGGMFGGEDLSSVLEYTEAHGGGTIAVDSQSGASSSIIEEDAEVAGIGGFSGKESSVSASWLEQRIDSGAITWIYTSGLNRTSGGPGGGGDTRTGSESAIDTVVKSCTKVSFSAFSSSAAGEGEESSSSATLYRCGES
jgi:hypothetical protein